eukprot:2259710-Rhodomonas_salina.2
MRASLSPSMRRSLNDHPAAADSFRSVRESAIKLSIDEGIAVVRDVSYQKVIRLLEVAIFKRQKMITAISVFTVLIAVYVNEICVSRDYVETENPGEEQPQTVAEGTTRECKLGLATALKIAQSMLTVVLLVLVILQFRADLRIDRIRHSVRKDKETDYFKDVRKALRLVSELFLCGIHQVASLPPPGSVQRH